MKFREQRDTEEQQNYKDTIKKTEIMEQELKEQLKQAMEEKSELKSRFQVAMKNLVKLQKNVDNAKITQHQKEILENELYRTNFELQNLKRKRDVSDANVQSRKEDMERIKTLQRQLKDSMKAEKQLGKVQDAFFMQCQDVDNLKGRLKLLEDENQARRLRESTNFKDTIPAGKMVLVIDTNWLIDHGTMRC